MGRSKLIDAIEAAYAIEEPQDEAWIARIMMALQPHVGNALGANGFMYDLRVRPMRGWSMVEQASPMPSAALSAALQTATDEYIEKSWKRILAGTAAEVPGFTSEPAYESFFRPSGILDVFSINAYNPSGVGCTIGHPLSQALVLKKKERELWSRIAMHIASGLRLRLRLRETSEEPDAVLSPSGDALHAENRAKIASAREALRNATRAIERAKRSSTKDGLEDRMDAWTAMVDAEWTLVDRFDTDGKRYVLARANEVATATSKLTARESQVVSLLQLGHHAKLVAYELGISYSTVRVLLARAMRKLGVKTQSELATISTSKK